MKKLAFTLALSLIVSTTVPNATAYAAVNPATPVDVSEVSMENVTGINYADSVGYYLEKEIPQGLEFIILGEGDFALMKNAENEGYYLVEGNGERSQFSDGSNSAVSFSTNESSYYEPSTPISKVSGNRTLEGVWWGVY